MKRLNRKGFTLVEIMIVVAIIGLLAAIAIPNFLAARTTAQANACQSNMRTLQGALEMALINGDITTGNSLLAAALTTAVTPYMRKAAVCPTAGAYTTTAAGLITCSNHGVLQ